MSGAIKTQIPHSALEVTDMAVLPDIADTQSLSIRGCEVQPFGAYLLFRVDDGAAARAGLTRLLPYISSGATLTGEKPEETLHVFLSAEGLRRIGVHSSRILRFPSAFVDGMADFGLDRRDADDNAPENWDWPHGGTGFHIGILLSARTFAGRDASIAFLKRMLVGLTHLRLLAHLNVGFSKSDIEYSRGPGLEMFGECALGKSNARGVATSFETSDELSKNGLFVVIRKIRVTGSALQYFLNRGHPSTVAISTLGSMFCVKSACYGPPLSKANSDNDGEDRGIVFFVIGSEPERQAAALQREWANYREEGGLTGLGRNIVVRGGEYVFLPGVGALTWLAGLSGGVTARGR
jgi:hypothetical protein